MSYNPPTQFAALAPDLGASYHGFLAWSVPVTSCNSSGSAPTSAQLQLTRVHLPVAALVTNIVLFVQSVTSVSLTAGESFAGIYTSAGALVTGSSTSDQSTAWTTTGAKVMAIGTPQTLAAADYYVGFFAVGSTLPTFARATASFSILNINLSSSAARFATGSGSLTTSMPSSAGTLAGSSNAFWAALS